ncbi:MAG: hypothetical protein LPK03_10950 [Pontibacter sp.]|nr:hypothetical protein [Pontibacter sp.]
MEAEEKDIVIVVKEDELCTMKINLSISLITFYCKQHLNSEQVRQNLLEMLQQVRKYEIKYLMGQVRALHYLSIEDANWLWNKVMPEMRASTIIKWARIEEPSSMLELNSIFIKNRLKEEGTQESELQFDSFLDEESALHWLLHE